MKRWWIAIVGLIIAYALLRYGSRQVTGIGMALIASAILLLGFWIALGKGRVHSRSVAHWLIAAMTALSCCSLLTLFFLHTPAALDEVSEQVIEYLSGPEQRQTQQLEQHVNQRKKQSGNWLWNEQNIRPLPRRANLKPGNQPEVFLQLDDSAESPKLMQRRAYISAFALGTYGDAAWSLTPADTANPPAFPLRPGKLLRYEIFHPSDPSGQTPLVALQGLRDAEIAPLSYRGDGIVILPPSEGVIGYRYRASSQPLAIDDLDDKAQAAARTSVPAAWLQLPDDDNLVMGIRGLNAESVTAGSLKKQLLQIRASLSEECRYSLDIANPDNRDPLENFLFYEKSGHCELFATAGVMAARAMGIPARISYGWAGGSYYETSNLFVFRAREAHAWTEVLIADVGWVVMDCTPAAAIGQSRSAPPGEAPLSDEEEIAMEDQQDLAEQDLTRISAVIGIIGLVTAALAAACKGWSRKQVTTTHPALAASAAPTGYYRAFLQFCGQQQIVVKPHHTLHQLLRKFSSIPPFATSLQRYHYSTRYGRNTPDATTEKTLQQEIRELIE